MSVMQSVFRLFSVFAEENPTRFLQKSINRFRKRVCDEFESHPFRQFISYFGRVTFQSWTNRLILGAPRLSVLFSEPTLSALPPSKSDRANESPAAAF